MNRMPLAAAAAASLLAAGAAVGVLSVAAQPENGSADTARPQPGEPAASPMLRQASEEPSEASEQEQLAMDLAQGLSAAFRRAARIIEPSVVHIDTVRTARNNPMMRTGGGLGSGVIATEDGFILTNSHVVENASQLRVRLSDGREFAASVVGRDPTTDLAVVRIEASGLTPATFRDSDTVEVGDWVIAAGSPFGFDQSVTAGIVSAKGRSGVTRNDTDSFEDFIQTDAAVNPGNSGGPLVDLDGNIVGINTAIFSRSGGSNGIGFAIPSNIVQAVFDDLAVDGRVDRAWLGVSMRDLTPEGVRTYGVAGTGGVYVERVVEQSPAFNGDLRRGDIITRVNSRPVRDSTRLRNLIALSQPGAQFDLEVIRDGERLQLRTILTDQATGLASSLAQLGSASSSELGLVVVQSTPELLRQNGQPTWLEGVLVAEVLPGTPAAEAGIRPRDVIVALEGVPTPGVGAFEDVMDAIDFGRGVEVELYRRGRSGKGMIRP